ncbi:MAG: EAL domain-containing protein [Candidatus Saccharibacteria bacterium]|nr:EAL domain-containing protein [Rhodoferax sp.]
MTPQTHLQNILVQGTGFWPQRIGRRLALGFGVLVALMLLVLSQVGLQLRVVGDITRQFATGDMQRLLRVQQLSLQTEGVGTPLTRLLYASRQNREREYAEIDDRTRHIDNIIESLSNDLKDIGQEETLLRLKEWRARYQVAYEATADEVEKEDLPAATRALIEQASPALKAMLQESNHLLQRERERIETQLADAQALFHKVTLWVGGLSAVVVSLAAWLAWRTTGSVVTPLRALESAARDIAQGNYASRVPITGTTEIDRVGGALNTMAETVAQREQQIVRLAYKDALTGLPNRTALLQPMQGPATVPNTVALLDLARLKAVNETLGYTTGDTLIRQLGQRTAAVFSAPDMTQHIGLDPVVARLSGGTFAAAFCAPTRADAQALHVALKAAMAQAVHCSGHNVDMDVSIGYADSTSAIKPLSVDTLLRNAEVALHTAKRTAQGHAWHSEAQEAARLDHLSLVTDLRRAVADSQLQMWLQPKFSLITGHPVGAEALVRWQHPVRGFVSAAEFVPFAEQTGYITLVTDWMLREALRTLVQWAPRQPQLTIAVNVSTRDLQNAGFAMRVSELLQDSGIEPRRLRLEITESGLMEDPNKSIALLHTLRDLGTPLSIDDFGTGYSSLAYLQQLPVTELKIDRAFIDRIDTSSGSQKLVRAMTEMGHGMDLIVTAEGVETEAERDTVAALGCDVMQGYLTSRPLHGTALQHWFEGLPANPKST